MVEVALKFFRGKKGSVVARMPDGRIALVYRKAKYTPKEGETWVCRAVFERPNYVVVEPVEQCTKTYKYRCGCVDRVPSDENETIELNYYCREHSARIVHSCGHEFRDMFSTGTIYKNTPCPDCEVHRFLSKIQRLSEKIKELRQIPYKQETWHIRARELMNKIAREGYLAIKRTGYIREGDGLKWYSERNEQTVYKVLDGLAVEVNPDNFDEPAEDISVINWVESLDQHWLKKLKHKEEQENERIYRENQKLRAQWLEENREVLDTIMTLYHELGDEAKRRIRQLIDPYYGLFGKDPTPEQILKLLSNFSEI
jgi:hypothetical protein